MLFIDNCQEISQESYEISSFKQHKHLKLLCVAHNREALSVHCVVELLKYTNSKVLLDIRGHHFTQECRVRTCVCLDFFVTRSMVDDNHNGTSCCLNDFHFVLTL